MYLFVIYLKLDVYVKWVIVCFFKSVFEVLFLCCEIIYQVCIKKKKEYLGFKRLKIYFVVKTDFAITLYNLLYV